MRWSVNRTHTIFQCSLKGVSIQRTLLRYPHWVIWKGGGYYNTEIIRNKLLCLLSAINERTTWMLMFYAYFYFSWLLIMLFHEFNEGVCYSLGNCYVLSYELLLWFSVLKPYIKGRVGWFIELRTTHDIDSLHE